MKYQVLKPKCECGYIPMESWDKVCPRDKKIMKTQLVEIEV